MHASILSHKILARLFSKYSKWYSIPGVDLAVAPRCLGDYAERNSTKDDLIARHIATVFHITGLFYTEKKEIDETNVKCMPTIELGLQGPHNRQ